LLVGHNPIESRGFVVLEVVFSRNFTAWEEHKNVMTAPKAPIVFDMRCDFDVRMEVSLTSQMKLPPTPNRKTIILREDPTRQDITRERTNIKY